MQVDTTLQNQNLRTDLQKGWGQNISPVGSQVYASRKRSYAVDLQLVSVDLHWVMKTWVDFVLCATLKSIKVSVTTHVVTG